ncbi:transmembrane protein 65 isoform X1 [Electrophorus electricus]|uniref:transmembrane protein 65 isoform X1 n=1 Tax=Electrophorus electricus TaxID=8005 RepID=UPI0015CFA437|nr:transmembrane protein 65 isoform X1 [Electrophorus electricus]
MLRFSCQRALGPCALGGARGSMSFRRPALSRAQKCFLGTHKHKEKLEPLNTPRGAKDFIYSLHPTERSCLLKELQSFESEAIAQDHAPFSRRVSRHSMQAEVTVEKLEPSPPNASQLRYVLLHNAIPFIGFGFLDNAIMIAAGTQIEMSIGVTFGISTMAAAALGNLVSDLAGLGLAGYVEALAARLGMQIPDLTPKQADMWQTRLSSHLGKAIGVTIGCLLGMFPLLFLSDEDEEKTKNSLLSTPSDSK